MKVKQMLLFVEVIFQFIYEVISYLIKLLQYQYYYLKIVTLSVVSTLVDVITNQLEVFLTLERMSKKSHLKPKVHFLKYIWVGNFKYIWASNQNEF